MAEKNSHGVTYNVYNNFAAACYETYGIHELRRRAAATIADPQELAEWNISADEWHRCVSLALAEHIDDLVAEVPRPRA